MAFLGTLCALAAAAAAVEILSALTAALVVGMFDRTDEEE